MSQSTRPHYPDTDIARYTIGDAQRRIPPFAHCLREFSTFLERACNVTLAKMLLAK